jgi:hypothetical protein
MKKPDLTARCRQFEDELQTIGRRASIQRSAKSLSLDPPIQGASAMDRANLLPFRRWGHSMLAVNLATAWSDFAQDIFIGSVCRDPSRVGASLELTFPKHLPYAVCEALFTTRGYFAFRNTGELKGLGNKFLVANPFQAITRTDERLLDELALLRNYVVHRSGAARRTYRDKVLRPNKTGTDLVEPGNFLLGIVAGRTRFERYLTGVRSAANCVNGAIT